MDEKKPKHLSIDEKLDIIIENTSNNESSESKNKTKLNIDSVIANCVGINVYGDSKTKLKKEKLIALLFFSIALISGIIEIIMASICTNIFTTFSFLTVIGLIIFFVNLLKLAKVKLALNGYDYGNSCPNKCLHLSKFVYVYDYKQKTSIKVAMWLIGLGLILDLMACFYNLDSNVFYTWQFIVALIFSILCCGAIILFKIKLSNIYELYDFIYFKFKYADKVIEIICNYLLKIYYPIDEFLKTYEGFDENVEAAKKVLDDLLR